MGGFLTLAAPRSVFDRLCLRINASTHTPKRATSAADRGPVRPVGLTKTYKNTTIAFTP